MTDNPLELEIILLMRFNNEHGMYAKLYASEVFALIGNRMPHTTFKQCVGALNKLCAQDMIIKEKSKVHDDCRNYKNIYQVNKVKLLGKVGL